MIKRDKCPACQEYQTLHITLKEGIVKGICSDCGAVFRVYPGNMVNIDIDLILQLLREDVLQDIKNIGSSDESGIIQIKNFISFIDLIEQIFYAPTGENAEYKVLKIKEEPDND